MPNYQSYPDSSLAALLKEGDRSAFAEIYERYKWVLHAHAYKMLSDREEAKDVVQEVFANLWAKRKTLRLKSNLSGYLYTAVKNRILNLIAHEQVKTRYINSIQHFAASKPAIADYLVREKQLAERIEREINALPERMREIFLMNRREYLSHKEIAEALEISEKTVNRQISNALKILRTKLGFLPYLIFLLKF